MDRFLEKFNFPRLNQEEIEIISNPIISTEIEAVIKKSPQNTQRCPCILGKALGGHLEMLLAVREGGSTHLESRFPYHDSRAMTHSPSPLAWRLDFPGATRRLPELPVIPREKSHTGSPAPENPRDASVIAR